MTVVFSPAALVSLDRIWDWNAEQYGADHADRYVAFLPDYWAGIPVPRRPGLRYIIIRWTRKGHGHLAVYQTRAGAVEIFEFFHTAQDWQSKLADDSE